MLAGTQQVIANKAHKVQLPDALLTPFHLRFLMPTLPGLLVVLLSFFAPFAVAATLTGWAPSSDPFSANAISAAAPLADVAGARVRLFLSCKSSESPRGLMALMMVSGTSFDVSTESDVHTIINWFGPNEHYTTDNRAVTVDFKWDDGEPSQMVLSGSNSHQVAFDIPFDTANELDDKFSLGDHLVLGFSVEGNPESISIPFNSQTLHRFVGRCEAAAKKDVDSDPDHQAAVRDAKDAALEAAQQKREEQQEELEADHEAEAERASNYEKQKKLSELSVSGNAELVVASLKDRLVKAAIAQNLNPNDYEPQLEFLIQLIRACGSLTKADAAVAPTNEWARQFGPYDLASERFRRSRAEFCGPNSEIVPNSIMYPVPHAKGPGLRSLRYWSDGRYIAGGGDFIINVRFDPPNGYSDKEREDMLQGEDPGFLTYGVMKAEVSPPGAYVSGQTAPQHVDAMAASLPESAAASVNLDAGNKVLGAEVIPASPPSPPVSSAVAAERPKCRTNPAAIIVPEGAQLDANGCPLDSDGDGVPDYLDKCSNTPAGTLVGPDGCPKVIIQAIRQEINITFDEDEAVVKPEFRAEVEKVANLAKLYPTSYITIDGYTDIEENVKLSQARAKSVRDTLVNDFGIDPTHISVNGFGSASPVASNGSADGRALNRRVIAVLTTEQKKMEMGVAPKIHHHKAKAFPAAN